MLAAASRRTGRQLAPWVHTFASDTVVISGGLCAAGLFLPTPLEAEIRRCGLSGYKANLRFMPAAMGKVAGVIDAAARMVTPQVSSLKAARKD